MSIAPSTAAMKMNGLRDVPTESPFDYPTTRMYRWYRGTIVPALAESVGFESHDEMHRHLKAGFYEMHPDDPAIPSMRDMTKEEAGRYMHWCCRQAAERDRVIEDPDPTKRRYP